MPKIKLPTKSPHIDMTPMVDLFSVVLNISYVNNYNETT